MELIDPKKLAKLIAVLRANSVASFSCAQFSLTLAPLEPQPEKSQLPDEIAQVLSSRKRVEDADAAKHGVYAHRSLWRDGKPPSFAGSESKTSPNLGDS